MRVMSEKLYKYSIESINNARELLDKQNDELIKLRRMNREIYKIEGFTKLENIQEGKLYFEIDYVYKHQNLNSSESRYLKFIYKTEHGSILLSGTFNELTEHYEKSN